MSGFRLVSRLAMAAPRVAVAPRAAFTAVPRMTPSLVRLYSAGPAPLTPQIVEERVLNILKDFDKVDAAKLNLDAHFINDLGLDSLDQVEITMALEDEFNIEIPDRDAEEIMTARQAADKIYSNKNAM
ncbi:hypothetical protein HDU85_006997 [Gaertneriomyces sp. JEL0708]|nr:hypothetical protein HDU85_006997 [Gaertneriomyces sp. JEL0708]